MFTSDVNLVRREAIEKTPWYLLEKGLSLVGCLRTDLAGFGETPDYISMSGQGNFTTVQTLQFQL